MRDIPAYGVGGCLPSAPAAASGKEGRAETAPRQALTPPAPTPGGRGEVSQLRQVGARGSAGNVPWGPARVPASELLELLWRGRREG